MGLSDIFDNSPKKQAPETTSNLPHQGLTGAAIDIPNPLSGLADEAAVTFDREVSAALKLKTQRTTLMDSVDQQLAPLKEELAKAREASKAAGKELQAAMDAAGVTKVPMPDRKPIQIKTKMGAKKSITKTWLTSTLGDEQAESLWGQVPRHPDSRVIEVPKPYDDQPND